MPTTADAIRLRGNWRVMPDRRNASFFRRLTVGPPATYDAELPVTNLWHRDLRNASNPGNAGVYVVYECTLYFPKGQTDRLPLTNPPLPGDQVQDSTASIVPYTNRRWTIASVEEAGSLGVWKLGCVAPAIVAGVAVAISIQQPTVTITDSGLRNITAWSTITNGSQNVWVQIDPAAAGDTLGNRQIPRLATVYLPTVVAVTAQMTVLDGAGRRYTITEVRYPTDFTTLQELSLELLA